MSDINLDFTVSNNNIGLIVVPNDITITPTDINLSVYAGGLGIPAGTTGQLQYNNGGVLGGVANTSYASGNLSLGDVANIKIDGGTVNYVLQTDGAGNLSWVAAANSNYASYAGNVVGSNQPNITSVGNLTALTVIGESNLGPVGNVIITGGTNGYVLQTDGTGNLTWTAQTGNGGGNGTPGGANTQIQYNDSGNFGGSAGFTFDKDTTIFVANNIVATSSANLGAVGNVTITGGNSGQVLSTDGSGNLTFITGGGGGGWTGPSNIAVNDLLFGLYYGANTGIMPGNTVTVASSIDVNSWSTGNTTNTVGAISNFAAGGNYMYATTATSNIARTQTGIQWTDVATPFIATGIIQANNNLVIYRSGSNNSAYSTNNGNAWTYANNNNTTFNLRNSAYGNGTIIIIRAELTSNNFIKSHDDGLTWSNSNTGGNTYVYTDVTYGNNKFIATRTASATAIRTTDNGNNWSNISLGNAYLWRQFAYGNGKWVGISEYTSPSTLGVAVVSTDDGNTWTTTALANLAWSDIVYANGTFIAGAGSGGSGNVIISTDGITWSNGGNTGIGTVDQLEFNSTEQLLVAGDNGVLVASTITPKITVTSSDGNLSNIQSAPAGTYRNLGGAIGNVGSMWIRTA